ncbi:MAG: hypothetical protein PHV82_13565 [Victivallaceae bacterium]|nr:hypothetical protein [Victivallaceae bacterium]
MAEAIRWFLEKKMGNSQWTPRSDWQIVIEKCSGDIDKFKELVDGKELLQKYC